MSSGNECLTPFTVTDFTTAFAGKPDTAIADGYGAPAPAEVEPGAIPGIVTDPPLENVLVDVLVLVNVTEYVVVDAGFAYTVVAGVPAT
jgi:hypothetical protein